MATSSRAAAESASGQRGRYALHEVRTMEDGCLIAELWITRYRVAVAGPAGRLVRSLIDVTAIDRCRFSHVLMSGSSVPGTVRRYTCRPLTDSPNQRGLRGTGSSSQ